MKRNALEVPEPGAVALGGSGHAHDVQGRVHPAPALVHLDGDGDRRHGHAEHVGAHLDLHAVFGPPHDLYRVQVGVELRRPLEVAGEAPHLIEGGVDHPLLHPYAWQHARHHAQAIEGTELDGGPVRHADHLVMRTTLP